MWLRDQNIAHACQQVHAYTSMVTLKELILKRPLLKEDCLNLLLSFSTHEKSEVIISIIYESSSYIFITWACKLAQRVAFPRMMVKATVIVRRVRNPACTATKCPWKPALYKCQSAPDAHAYCTT